MKKIFVLEDLECAHCAARMEEGIRKLQGVTDASVNFIAQRLTLEADDAIFDKVLKQAVKLCRRIEPDCKVITK
ncbi:MAG: heavy-metal-associated domain-containing protein [Clostridia bacterium]|nr:heavy-metal-associated domain-containing protein [Clostridia bacterium]